jgi:hypothetical protein
LAYWSSEEIDVLKKEYPIHGRNIPEIFKNHPYRSIQMKASQLKIKYNRFNGWTEEEKIVLKKEYPISGSNIPKLLLSRSVESIRTRAHRLNLHWSNYQKWSKEDITFLRNNAKRLTHREIAERLDKKKDSVNVKSSVLKIKSGHIKDVNVNFFKDWSEEMAYILGLWFADGNMSKELTRFSICSIDIELLNKVKKAMQSKHPLRLNKSGSRAYTLTVGRKEMCNDVVSLGGVPKKSLIAIFPYVPKKFVHHFIRGNLDGDGSISLGYKGYPKISFLGTDNFLQGVLNNVGVEGKVIKSNFCRIYCLTFSGLKAQKVLEYIYDDSHIYLERKHKRYLKAMEWKPKMSKHWTKDEDEILKEHYPTMGNSITEILKDRPINSIRYRAMTLGLHPPPHIKKGNNPTLSFRIKKEEKERLKEICLISGKTIQQLIRENILEVNL